MKSVLLVFILCIVLSEIFASLQNEWSQFKRDYNKTYRSRKENLKKFKVFKLNVKEINKHNRRFNKGLESYEKGITVFADLSKKQFDKKYGLRLRQGTLMKYKDIPRKLHIQDTTNISREYLDWREKGAVTHVKEQGICGACWIFSAVGMLEGYNFRKTGHLISLSEQNVVDCFSNTTCKGGFPGDAIMYLKENGVSKEADYPYREKQKKCRNDVPKIKIDFKGYEFKNGTEADLKSYLEKYGPLGVSLYASGTWRLYKRGVWYEKQCSEVTNHALVLVGYGTENGNDYWLIKNSWGTLWGEDGYIKIARNKHHNYCGLTNEAMYID